MVVFSVLLFIFRVCQILRCWKKVSGGPELGRVFVCPVSGRVIGRGWVVRLILWLLEFYRGTENFVGGHVRFVI